MAAITAPFVHVPPVMLKVPGPVVVPRAGFAVSVIGPAFVPVAVLVTVMVPECVLVEPFTRVGVISEKLSVPPVTLKATVPV